MTAGPSATSSAAFIDEAAIHATAGSCAERALREADVRRADEVLAHAVEEARRRHVVIARDADTGRALEEADAVVPLRSPDGRAPPHRRAGTGAPRHSSRSRGGRRPRRTGERPSLATPAPRACRARRSPSHRRAAATARGSRPACRCAPPCPGHQGIVLRREQQRVEPMRRCAPRRHRAKARRRAGLDLAAVDQLAAREAACSARKRSVSGCIGCRCDGSMVHARRT